MWLEALRATFWARNEGFLHAHLPSRNTSATSTPTRPLSKMPDSHSLLGAATDERKARLSKYKSLKRKQRDDEDPAPETDAPAPEQAGENATTLPLHLSGRNYDPETRGPKLGFDAPPVRDEDETLEKQAEKIEAQLREKAEEDARDDKGIDLFKLQPKKPNWDLKRELNKKLEILSVRTDNAIARLVRERLAAKKASAQGSSAAGLDGSAGGLEGAVLVESIRVREQEERRAREADELGLE